MKFFELYKTPLYDAADDLGGGESLIDEGHEEDVDLKDGEGTGEADSETNQKPKQDRDTNEQFKAARVAAENEKQRLIDEREQDAKDAGFESYAEMQTYIKQRKEEAERKAYTDAGIDPDMLNQAINNHPAIRQAQDITNKARIDSEIASLQGKSFFKELEPEIRRTLEVNPSLNAVDVYSYIKGVKADELLVNAKTMAEKRTTANIAERKSRGLTDTADGNLDTDVELTAEGMEMAQAFGNDPKKIATHVKNSKRR
jgi:hypothetical protein